MKPQELEVRLTRNAGQERLVLSRSPDLLPPLEPLESAAWHRPRVRGPGIQFHKPRPEPLNWLPLLLLAAATVAGLALVIGVPVLLVLSAKGMS